MYGLPVPTFERTPFTLILAAAVVALEIVCEIDSGRRDYYYNDLKLGIFWQIWRGEIWRPFTTTLLHANLLHAAYNVYFLVIFGTALELRFGPWRMAGLTVLLAMVSSLDQYVLAQYFVSDVRQQGGLVGLSGVVYGLFGVLFVGRRSIPGWAEVLTLETVRLMLGWLVFCFIASWLELMPVANAAHVGGLAMGWLIGQAAFAPVRQTTWRVAAVAVAGLTLATLVAAPGHAGYELAQRVRQIEALEPAG